MLSPQNRHILYDWIIHVNGDETNISSFLYGQTNKKGINLTSGTPPLIFMVGQGRIELPTP
jgi:hypothetical protein